MKYWYMCSILLVLVVGRLTFYHQTSRATGRLAKHDRTSGFRALQDIRCRTTDSEQREAVVITDVEMLLQFLDSRRH